MQPRLAVGVLVLQAEGLVCAIRYPGFLFQTAPTSVVDKANQIAILIGHFSWNADLIAVEVVGLLAVFASERVAFYGNAAVVVAFAVAALSVGIDAVDEFAVFIETVHFRPSQCVGNDGMVFAVFERPFFAEVVAALEHFAVGVVTVVFVAGHQSVGLAVFDHDVVAVGETAQFFAVASVNGGQIAVAKIDFGKQQPCAAFG